MPCKDFGFGALAAKNVSSKESANCRQRVLSLVRVAQGVREQEPAAPKVQSLKGASCSKREGHESKSTPSQSLVMMFLYPPLGINFISLCI